MTSQRSNINKTNKNLYSKMLECVQNPKKYSESAEKRFLTILSRQQDDLEKLITLILGK